METCPRCRRTFPQGALVDVFLERGGRLTQQLLCGECGLEAARGLHGLEIKPTLPSEAKSSDSAILEYPKRNQEHYEKIRRVLSKSDAVMAAMVKEFGQIRGMVEAIGQCRTLWADEFPRKDGNGGQVRLDLSSADFSGGLFVGHGRESAPLNHANLQDAKLDRTRWLMGHLMDADLTRASLRGSTIAGLVCEGVVFREADLSGADIQLFPGTDSKPVDFTNANFTGATIKLILPIPIILTGAKMNGCRVVPTTTSTNPQDVASYNQARDAFFSGLSEEQRAQMKGRCFIATAAWGSEQADDVVHLRAYRDEILLRARAGRMFIATYEAVSPPLARFIARSAFARRLARSLIVRPARRLAESLLNLRRA
jgi:uncharacterized protein YjbI with pentapeptide repeats